MSESSLLITIRASELAALKRTILDLTARSSFNALMVSELTGRLAVSSALLAEADERGGPPDWNFVDHLSDANLCHAANGLGADSMLAVADRAEAALSDEADSENRAAMERAIARARQDAPALRAMGEAATAPKH